MFGVNTFLMYLFAYMETMNWINIGEIHETKCQILENTFLPAESKYRYVKADRGRYNKIYLSLIQLNIRKIINQF
jgi:hypothetical protein